MDSLEVLSHPWFEELDWSLLLEKKIIFTQITEIKL